MALVNSCKFCHREGLAILPVRARIIHDDPESPINCKLPQTVDVPVESTQQTKYVGSVLQDGYLYIYNERAQEWLDFYVTPDNYYYRLITGTSADQSVKAGKAQPCATEPTDQCRASFISLPYFRQPADNGVFWFTWAKVEWTDAVRKRHEDASYRAQYMQPFDMRKWVANQQEKNCYDLQQVKSTVLEYQNTKLPKVKWATEFFNEKNNLLKYAINRVTGNSLDLAAAFYSLLTDKNPEPLISEAVRISGSVKPAIIVLNDPTAIMEDIGKLCDAIPNKEIYCNPNYERGIWLNSTLASIKGSVVKQGRETAEANVERSIAGMSNEDYLPSSLGLSTQEYEALMRGVAERQGEYDWVRGYEKYIDTAQQTAFMSTVNTLAEKLAKDVIEPLITSFKQMIYHTQTVNYFMGNFDDENLQSGGSFAQLVVNTFLPMLGKKMVLDECISMLELAELTEKNYFVRAFYLNQKSIEQSLEQIFQSKNLDGLFATSPVELKNTPSDLSGLPWQNVVEAVGQINEINPGMMIQSMDEVFHSLSAPLLPLFSKGLENDIPTRSVVFASALANKKLVPVLIEGTYEKIAWMIQEKGIQVMESQGKSVSQDAKFNAKKYLKERGISEKGKNGKGILKVYLFLDPSAEATIKALPLDERLAGLRQALELTPENTYLAEQKVKLAYKNAVFNVKVNGVSSVIQAMILYSTAKTAFAADASQETYRRWVSGAFGLAGTILGGFETATKTFTSLKAVAGSLWVKIPLIMGRGFIAVSGTISIYYDGKHVWDEWSKGNYGLAGLYFISASSTFVLTVIGTLGWTNPVAALIALGVYLLVQFLITIFSDNDIQKWLQKCLWGKRADTSLIPFQTLKQEQDSFNTLIEVSA